MPSPNRDQDMNCDALNAERTRLLAERDELKSPLLSTNTDTEREAEVTQLNGKLYTWRRLSQTSAALSRWATRGPYEAKPV